MNERRGRQVKIHFSGIGGTAMIAGAKLAIDLGHDVRGSDNPLYPPTSEMVRELAVPVMEGYRAENLDWNPDLVIVGNVLSRGNPEIEAMLERRLKYLSLPEWLKESVLRERRPVVVCGTHGKTTTTALTAYLLEETGFRPGYFIGGQPLDFPFPSKLGDRGAPFVIEGDEYDTAFFDKRAKFMHYLPDIAIVTSIEFDHGDIFSDIEEIKRSFRLMLRQVPRNGRLIVCADDPGAVELAEYSYSESTSYGFSENAEWRGELIGPGRDGKLPLRVYHGGEVWADLEVPLAGRHNMQNALAAVATAGILGARPYQVAEAIARFKGVRRRMEVFLRAGGRVFVDDFAHHPTAIRETIAAARMRWPQRFIRVLFEPRSNTTVTNRFQDELEQSFTGADAVCIGPLYRAERVPAESRLDREKLCRALISSGIKATYSDDPEEIVESVKNDGREGELVLILSNGAFGGIYQRIREVFTGS